MTFVNEPTLDQRAASIVKLWKAADKSRIEVGRELIAARQHVEAQGIGWLAWCKVNIKRSRQDIHKVMKLAGAEDPDAALEAEQAATREARADRSDVASMRHATPAETPPPAVLAEAGFFGPQPQLETPPVVEVEPAPASVVEVVAGIEPVEVVAPVRPQAADVETAGETNKRILLSAAFDMSELSDTLISIVNEREIESAPDLREILDSTERAIESWRKLAACLAGEINRHSPVEVVAAVEPAPEIESVEEVGGFAPEALAAIEAERQQAKPVEVSAPVIIKAKGRRSPHGPVLRLTVEQLEAAKRKEAETPKERADRRRARLAA